MMDVFSQAVEKIIHSQENIVGPVALEQAKKVPGLKVNGSVTIDGDQKEVIGKLVQQYEQLFGRASVEVCKEAVRGLELPAIPALK